MQSNELRALQLVLAHEGGYVDHPKDPGGPTNKGITQKVYDTYRTSKGLQTQSVRAIADEEVAEIYDQEYWDRAKADLLPSGIDYACFDYSVNSGVSRAVSDLQRAINAILNVNLSVDGICGQSTIEAASKADVIALIEAYCDRRLAFMKSLKTW